MTIERRTGFIFKNKGLNMKGWSLYERKMI